MSHTGKQFTHQSFVGFMKHLPNLLKQESSSASTLVHILLRMYYDPRPDYQAARPQVADRLLPYVILLTTPTKISLTMTLVTFRLGLGVLQDFTKLKIDSQSKNIAAWTPVVAEIFDGFVRFDDKAVSTLTAEVTARRLSSAPVREVPPGGVPSSNRIVISRDRSRDTPKPPRVFYARGLREGHHRAVMTHSPIVHCIVYLSSFVALFV